MKTGTSVFVLLLILISKLVGRQNSRKICTFLWTISTNSADAFEDWNPYQQLRQPETLGFLVFPRYLRDFPIVLRLIHAFLQVTFGVLTPSPDRPSIKFPEFRFVIWVPSFLRHSLEQVGADHHYHRRGFDLSTRSRQSIRKWPCLLRGCCQSVSAIRSTSSSRWRLSEKWKNRGPVSGQAFW
jgi:hypothetical protein